MNRQSTSRTIAVATSAIVAVCMSSVAIGAGQRSETEGIKETEQFVKAGSETSSVKRPCPVSRRWWLPMISREA